MNVMMLVLLAANALTICGHGHFDAHHFGAHDLHAHDLDHHFADLHHHFAQPAQQTCQHQQPAAPQGCAHQQQQQAPAAPQGCAHQQQQQAPAAAQGCAHQQQQAPAAPQGCAAQQPPAAAPAQPCPANLPEVPVKNFGPIDTQTYHLLQSYDVIGLSNPAMNSLLLQQSQVPEVEVYAETSPADTVQESFQAQITGLCDQPIMFSYTQEKDKDAVYAKSDTNVACQHHPELAPLADYLIQVFEGNNFAFVAASVNPVVQGETVQLLPHLETTALTMTAAPSTFVYKYQFQVTSLLLPELQTLLQQAQIEPVVTVYRTGAAAGASGDYQYIAEISGVCALSYFVQYSYVEATKVITREATAVPACDQGCYLENDRRQEIMQYIGYALLSSDWTFATAGANHASGYSFHVGLQPYVEVVTTGLGIPATNQIVQQNGHEVVWQYNVVDTCNQGFNRFLKGCQCQAIHPQLMIAEMQPATSDPADHVEFQIVLTGICPEKTSFALYEASSAGIVRQRSEIQEASFCPHDPLLSQFAIQILDNILLTDVQLVSQGAHPTATFGGRWVRFDRVAGEDRVVPQPDPNAVNTLEVAAITSAADADVLASGQYQLVAITGGDNQQTLQALIDDSATNGQYRINVAQLKPVTTGSDQFVARAQAEFFSTEETGQIVQQVNTVPTQGAAVVRTVQQSAASLDKMSAEFVTAVAETLSASNYEWLAHPQYSQGRIIVQGGSRTLFLVPYIPAYAPYEALPTTGGHSILKTFEVQSCSLTFLEQMQLQQTTLTINLYDSATGAITAGAFEFDIVGDQKLVSGGAAGEQISFAIGTYTPATGSAAAAFTFSANTALGLDSAIVAALERFGGILLAKGFPTGGVGSVTYLGIKPALSLKLITTAQSSAIVSLPTP